MPGSTRRGSGGSGSSSGGSGGSSHELSDGNAGNGNSGGGGGHGGSSAGELGESRKQEGEWAAGPGAQRISPAVEALTMLARNNTKNRWDISKHDSKPHPTYDTLPRNRLGSPVDSAGRWKGSGWSSMGTCVSCTGGVLLMWRRAAAIQAGAVPALCGILQAGAAHSVPIALDDVLKACAAVHLWNLCMRVLDIL